MRWVGSSSHHFANEIIDSVERALAREPRINIKGQTTVSDVRIEARAACEIAEAKDYNESHC